MNTGHISSLDINKKFPYSVINISVVLCQQRAFCSRASVLGRTHGRHPSALEPYRMKPADRIISSPEL